MSETANSPGELPGKPIDRQLNFKRGDLVIRWVGYIGDAIVTVIVIFILLIFTGILGSALGASDMSDAIAFLLFVFLSFVFLFLYYPFMESHFMGTPCKMALGLSVVDMNGDRIGILRATLRSLVKLVCFCIPFGGLIGGLIGLLSDDRRTLWDLLSGTRVLAKA